MACLFCNSLYHLSQKCDVYSSRKSRKEFFAKNKLCEKCLSQSTWNDDGMEVCDDCGGHSNCFICFSRTHSAVFCPQKDVQLFAPKIDVNLKNRFFQTLDIVEKYSLAFSTPTYVNLWKPKGAVAKKTIGDADILYYWEKDLLVGEKIKLNSSKNMTAAFRNALASNAFSIRSADITINEIQKFSSEILFQLISAKTTKLTLKNVTFDAAIQISDIVSKFANIEEFEFSNTNLKIENIVLEDSKIKVNGAMKANLVTNIICDEKNKELPTQFSVTKPMKNYEISIRAKKIYMTNIKGFSKQLFFHLLSASTVKLLINNVTFDSPIKFSEILTKIPNIQKLTLQASNIEIENSWPEDMEKCIATKIDELILQLDTVNFDAEKLGELMATKLNVDSFVILEIKDFVISKSFLKSPLAVLLYSEHFAIRAKNIYICDVRNFPIPLLLTVLSSSTQKMMFKNSTFESPNAISEILFKIPCVEEIVFANIDLKLENSWLDSLLLIQNLQLLNSLSLKTDNFDFDFGKLAELLKFKLKTDFFLYLEINQPQNVPQSSVLLQEKIDTYFVPLDYSKSDQPLLSIAHIIHDSKPTIQNNFLLSLA